jgi:chromate transport protein ChrA
MWVWFVKHQSPKVAQMNYLTFSYMVFWAFIALADPALPELPYVPGWFQILMAALAGIVMQLSRLDIEGRRFRFGYLGMAAGVSAGMVSLLIWQGVHSPYLALPTGVVMGWLGVKGMELLEAMLPLRGRGGDKPPKEGKKEGSDDND